jgi:uncharacterized membrane protein YtjA (UPF0391 family)
VAIAGTFRRFCVEDRKGNEFGAAAERFCPGTVHFGHTQQEAVMIGFAITLLVIAAVAAILGFGGIAGALADVAIIIFVLALLAGLVMLFLGWKAGKALVDE